MDAYVAGPGNSSLRNGDVFGCMVIEFESLDFIAELVVHPRYGSAGEGRVMVVEWGACYGGDIAAKGL